MQKTNIFLTNIRKIVRMYDGMLKPVCERYELTPIEATIISFLYNNAEKDTAADIAEFRMLSKSNISKAVESLIGKSLIKRRQDTADRRKIHLILTEKSAPITAEIDAVRQAFRKRIFEGFTEKEIEEFTRFNQQIAENTGRRK